MRLFFISCQSPPGARRVFDRLIRMTNPFAYEGGGKGSGIYFTPNSSRLRLSSSFSSGTYSDKTSTGFSTAGATFDDIRLFAEHVGEGVRMKAAGGIKSFGDAEEFIRLGADRLGTSRIVKLAKAEKAGGQTAPDSDRY